MISSKGSSSLLSSSSDEKWFHSHRGDTSDLNFVDTIWREKEERDQIGNLVILFLEVLIDIEKSCLLFLFKAAREALDPRVVLNSVVRAQALEQQLSSLVSRGYTNGLSLHNERKHAVRFLELVASKPKEVQKLGAESELGSAVLLARSVIDLFTPKLRRSRMI